jgi:hypothetical protein
VEAKLQRQRAARNLPQRPRPVRRRQMRRREALRRQHPAQSVDVETVLTDFASQNPQQLNWRTSIVDLMKLLNLDSSLNARKELAQELHYSDDINDSAAMNIWLHKQVMQKLAENGGKVPDDLKS